MKTDLENRVPSELTTLGETEFSSQRLEEFPSRTVAEISTQESGEFSTRGMTEFFPEKKREVSPAQTKKKRRRRQTLMSKMLAATATLGVSVSVVFAAFKIHYPTVAEVQVLSYEPSVFVSQPTETDSTAGYYTQSNYTVAFPFALRDGKPLRIDIVGEGEPNPYLGLDRQESIPVFFSFPAEELTTTADGVMAEYVVEDISYDYTLTATLYYEVKDPESKEILQKSISTEPFLAGQSLFIPHETVSANRIDWQIKGERIYCTAVFNEARIGAFELRGERVEVDCADAVSGESLHYFEEEVELLPQGNGSFVYKFDFPKPQVDGVAVSVGLFGDSYFQGEKMDLSSQTFAAEEILLTSGYSVEQITADFTLESMQWNGLQASRVEMTDFYAHQPTESLQEVLPDKTVQVCVWLTGEATAEGTITLDLVWNEAKLGNVDVFPAYVSVGDKEVCVEFTFVMPAENVSAEDITILGIIPTT